LIENNVINRKGGEEGREKKDMKNIKGEYPMRERKNEARP